MTALLHLTVTQHPPHTPTQTPDQYLENEFSFSRWITYHVSQQNILFLEKKKEKKYQKVKNEDFQKSTQKNLNVVILLQLVAVQITQH